MKTPSATISNNIECCVAIRRESRKTVVRVSIDDAKYYDPPNIGPKQNERERERRRELPTDAISVATSSIIASQPPPPV